MLTEYQEHGTQIRPSRRILSSDCLPGLIDARLPIRMDPNRREQPAVAGRPLECGGGAETINFATSVFGPTQPPQTITLTGAQLELTDTTGTETMTGPAGGVMVSGGGLSRVFQVDNMVTANISGLTIIDGNSSSIGPYGSTYPGVGGGLRDYGTATLTDCIVAGNTATRTGGGVFSTISYFAPRGTETTTLTSCTISGNLAGKGRFHETYRQSILVACPARQALDAGVALGRRLERRRHTSAPSHETCWASGTFPFGYAGSTTIDKSGAAVLCVRIPKCTEMDRMIVIG
jgi:hypothetical protein